MTHTITLRKIEPVTHDTYRLIFDKPEGYSFTAGQACHMALDRDGWRDQDRPFTFTSQPEDEHLEFVIKSYPAGDPDHDGMTAQIPTLEPGDRVIIDAPSGVIEDRGPGVFIAGGAGITPFIPILRRRARDRDSLSACTLIFSNKTERDIILRDEWDAMEGLGTIFVVTDEPDSELPSGPIDGTFLGEVLKGFREHFYICGPKPMTQDIMDALKERGVPDAKIVQDQW
jgi:ferredoxin-NADP reductase